jgi:hypothetical protein
VKATDQVAVSILVASDETDEEIRDYMRTMRDLRHNKTTKHIVCLLGDFDDDPRELWEIPEAREVCQQLVRLGFVSYLDVTTCPTFNEPALSSGMGAREIILIAEGRFRKTMVIDRESFTEIEGKIREANERADKEIGPYDHHARN